jgi:hypothetical protein
MREYLIQRSAPTAEPISLVEAKLHLVVTITEDDSLITSLIAAARQYAESITRRALVAQKWSVLLDNFPRPGFNVGSANWYGPQWGINPGPLTVLSPDGVTGYEIYLPFAPTMLVESIAYVDTAGAPQTLATDQYQIDLSTPACLTPAFGTVWPETRMQKGAVTIKFSAGYVCPLTADAALNTVSIPIWPALAVNDTLRVSNSGGALPAPLAAATDYFIKTVASPGVYTLAATAGGSTIDITTPGTGTNFVGAVPEGILAWLKIRMGSLYENREEVALLNRGKIELLPFVDGLLDDFRVLTF